MHRTPLNESSWCLFGTCFAVPELVVGWCFRAFKISFEHSQILSARPPIGFWIKDKLRVWIFDNDVTRTSFFCKEKVFALATAAYDWTVMPQKEIWQVWHGKQAHVSSFATLATHELTTHERLHSKQRLHTRLSAMAHSVKTISSGFRPQARSFLCFVVRSVCIFVCSFVRSFVTLLLDGTLSWCYKPYALKHNVRRFCRYLEYRHCVQVSFEMMKLRLLCSFRYLVIAIRETWLSWTVKCAIFSIVNAPTSNGAGHRNSLKQLLADNDNDIETQLVDARKRPTCVYDNPSKRAHSDDLSLNSKTYMQVWRALVRQERKRFGEANLRQTTAILDLEWWPFFIFLGALWKEAIVSDSIH